MDVRQSSIKNLIALLSNSHFSLEVLAKVSSKLLSLGRSLLMLLVFNFTEELDEFYYAFSLIGAVLMINILFEMIFLPKIRQDEKEGIDRTDEYFGLLISIASILIVILVIVLGIIDKKVITINLTFLIAYAVLKVVSSFYVVRLRVHNEYKKLTFSFFLAALLTLFFTCASWYYFRELSFMMLSFPLMIAEFLVIGYLVFSTRELFALKISFHNLHSHLAYVSKEFLVAAVILSIITLIDITDKSFANYLGNGSVSLLSYGLMTMLILRQSIDVKSQFYDKLGSHKGRAIFVLQSKFLKRQIALVLIGYAIIILGYLVIGKFILIEYLAIDLVNLKRIEHVFLLSLIILPNYLYWDLNYRIYYHLKKLKSLLLVIISGFVINIILNWLFSVFMDFGVEGIVLSTLSVLVFYNLYSKFTLNQLLLSKRTEY